ncbi:MAG: cation:proton antiporter [Chitinivibrionales bacterium]|nr:cation:proton antiporter [Chitinivibrionales bacterium]
MSDHIPIFLVLSIIVGISLLIKPFFFRLKIPALSGWICLGIALAWLNVFTNKPFSGLTETIEVLGQIGVVFLLFNIGLHSKLGSLVEYFGKASFIWLCNVLISAAIGFAAAWYILDAGMIVSLVIAVALTATSIGVSTASWQEAHALDSREGQLLVEVAELDDISSILLMAFVLSFISSESAGTCAAIRKTIIPFLLRIIIFSVFCILFMKFAEKRLTRCIQNIEPEHDLVITIIAIALVIASAAGLFGFSIAMGAFFAGLAFSRDPEAVKHETSFMPLYDLFSPFFFISIGFSIDPSFFASSPRPMLIILIAAVAGKLLGTVFPFRLHTSLRQAIILGISMVPRAEITMITIHQAHRIAPDKFPQSIVSSLALVALITAIVTPSVVERMLANTQLSQADG